MSQRPFHVAIVGAGPAGFYTAAALLKQATVPLKIDLIDRLPSPYGLVRWGVAPDHQTVKGIERAFFRTFQRPEVRFLGNVALGHDVSVAELQAHYHAIVYTIGNEGFRKIGLPGQQCAQVRSATEFVFWYNDHPHHHDRDFDLGNVRRVAIIGVGNVAVDVARILAKDRDALAETDISPLALAALRAAPIEEILLMGRRGPAQAAFSPKEIRELGDLEGVDVWTTPEDAALDPASADWMPRAPKTAARNLALVEALAERPRTGAARSIRCMFRVSPQSFVLDENGRMVGMTVGRNRLEPTDGRPRPVPTGESWVEDVQLVLTSIGYRGVPVEGVPFDPDAGTIPNVGGRVTDAPGGPVRPGEYTAGWARRGPTGLIGSNRPDAKEVAGALLGDLSAPDPREDLVPVLSARGVHVVSCMDWHRLDAEERRRGAAAGRVRTKFSSIQAMLDFLEDT